MTDLFHEDGIYLFLKPDSADEAFLQEFGVTREEINAATTLRHFNLGKEEPEYVFHFEGVPAMVLYSGPSGFGILLNHTDASLPALRAATDAILDGFEQQTGIRPALNRRDSKVERETAQIQISYQDIEDVTVITSMTIWYSN